MTKFVFFFCCAVFPFEKKEKIPLCNVFVCARSLLFHSNDSEKYIGMWNEKKRGHFRFLCPCSYLWSKNCLLCWNVMLESFVFFAMCKDGFPSPPFKKKKKERKKEGGKQAFMQLCAFVLLLCSHFCMWMMMYCAICDKRRKKKGLSCKCQFVVSYMIAFWTRPSVNCAVWTHLLKKKREVGGGVSRREFFFPFFLLYFFLFSFLLHFWSSHIFLWRVIKITSFFLYVIERFSSSLCLCLA